MVGASDGMLVLRASGVGSEKELPFSGLSELFAPLTERLDALPAPQATALAGALGLGPAAPGDPLTIAAATLSLLALGAEDGGLVAVVDDAHWLDSASLEALAFAARRLGAEGVALILAVREAEESVLDEADLPALVVSGLDAASARELLRRAAPELRPGVVEVVLETAAGNPLALYEIPRALSEAEVAGETPIAEPLRVGAQLEAHARQRTSSRIRFVVRSCWPRPPSPTRRKGSYWLCPRWERSWRISNGPRPTA